MYLDKQIKIHLVLGKIFESLKNQREQYEELHILNPNPTGGEGRLTQHRLKP